MLQIIITGIISAIGGGGIATLISVLINKKKVDQDVEILASEEWHKLYSNMKQELEEQKKENELLRSELESLKSRMIELATDIANYKQYDHYLVDMERYVDHLLHTIETIASEDAYKEALRKKPHKNDPISIQKIKEVKSNE